MTVQPIELAYLPQHDQIALLDWAGYHSAWHRLVAEAAVKRGHLDLGTYSVSEMSNMDDWLYFHNVEHENISETFNLAGVPDLSFWDQDDPVAFANWLYAHALVHDAERKGLNL
jgi:hypothetical protein